MFFVGMKGIKLLPRDERLSLVSKEIFFFSFPIAIFLLKFFYPKKKKKIAFFLSPFLYDALHAIVFVTARMQ